jgi:hypothetical protein
MYSTDKANLVAGLSVGAVVLKLTGPLAAPAPPAWQLGSTVDPYHIDADPDSYFLFDADPDPSHPDADPDPNPDLSFKKKAQTIRNWCGSRSSSGSNL